ncbi:PREDICTED: uncharacterized protein LOC108522051 [Rhinopithecus bieti]|uniref:uncharacterized protein LOC108522051 n=1 Tax=Rhinopithecus bieti TaxID=61621 RepID=UPI00083C88CE|nr:PREDICTED: uncharacterized protein LOC108522051 [Rhinopithecus bieti]XP_017717640.1 PREDICTED: uncharacterized protein LOC108522051 [Rhinopithecus bieti]
MTLKAQPAGKENKAIHEHVHRKATLIRRHVRHEIVRPMGRDHYSQKSSLTAALRSQLSRRRTGSSVHTFASRLEGGASDISSSTRTPEAQACVHHLQQSSTRWAVPSSVPLLFILTATKNQPVTKEWKEATLDPNFHLCSCVTGAGCGVEGALSLCSMLLWTPWAAAGPSPTGPGTPLSCNVARQHRCNWTHSLSALRPTGVLLKAPLLRTSGPSHTPTALCPGGLCPWSFPSPDTHCPLLPPPPASRVQHPPLCSAHAHLGLWSSSHLSSAHRSQALPLRPNPQGCQTHKSHPLPIQSLLLPSDPAPVRSLPPGLC